MTIKAIRTDADAIAYLGEHDAGVLGHMRADNVLTIVTDCHRCQRGTYCWGGTLNGMPMFSGVCFRCNGAYRKVERIGVKAYAQRHKRNAAARARVAAKREAEEAAKAEERAAKKVAAKHAADLWLEANPEVADIINDPAIEDATINDICESLNAYGSLTYKQANLVILRGGWARERMAKAAASEHVGEVGKRQEFTVTIRKILEWDGYYGTTYFHIMEDDDGNNIAWKASTLLDAPDGYGEGDKVRIKATVKEHGTHDGAAQTMVTRAKFIEMIEAVAEEAA